MDHSAVLGLLLVIVSPFVGSFMGVLADRLPRGQDIVFARSACRGCGTYLHPLQLVPILSFVIQGGRCKTCKAAIPPMLLYVEICAIGAAVLVAIKGGGVAFQVLNCLFLWLLITLSATDLKWFRLPDPLTGALAVVALALALLPGGLGIWHAVWGAMLGAGAFWALRQAYWMLRGREGLGLGDVKLMVGLGAFVGPYGVATLVLIAALTTLGVAAVGMLSDRRALQRQRALPFGAALCAAAGALWVLS